jgi:hypothetical protein
MEISFLINRFIPPASRFCPYLIWELRDNNSHHAPFTFKAISINNNLTVGSSLFAVAG